MTLKKNAICEIYKNQYRDSMVLMNISYQIREVPEIEQAMIVMGTKSNFDLLRQMNLYSPEVEEASGNDLVIGYRIIEGADVDTVSQGIKEILFQSGDVSARRTKTEYHSIESAIEAHPKSNLAVISLPGTFAAYEAFRALDSGLNVFMWSDNVPIEDEVKLKKKADSLGLMVMGPECGCSVVGKVCLGVASAAHSGPVGIVGASGSGLQEIYTLLDRAGVGSSHAIGTGGRDLSGPVGGITTLRCIDFFEQDEATKVIVNVSKQPEPDVATKIIERARSCSKPVVICFMGDTISMKKSGKVRIATSIEDAVDIVGEILGKKVIQRNDYAVIKKLDHISLRPEQKYIRGIYLGGTFCQEGMSVWHDLLGEVWSNHPFDSQFCLPDPNKSYKHTALDIGDEYFTVGRPHPCFDPIPRTDRINAELNDKEVAVIVTDLILGYGSHSNMANELIPVLKKAQECNVYIVAHVCGSDLDPQNVTKQEQILADNGAVIAETNAAAARIAVKILEKGMDNKYEK